MAGSSTIFFVFVINDGRVQKLGASKPPRAGLGGHFTWLLINETGKDIVVVMKTFTNDGGEEISDYLKPTPPYTIPVPGDPDHNEVSFTAKVKKHIPGTDVKFNYEVWVDGDPTDPELIVDGGGGGVPGDPKGKKVGKKKKR
jgi:hypothetical protein